MTAGRPSHRAWSRETATYVAMTAFVARNLQFLAVPEEDACENGRPGTVADG